MFAHVAIVDPTVTTGLLPHLTAATGIDAFTHALEAYTRRNPSPFTDLLALESLRLAWSALPRATTDGSDLAARSDMMLAATYGGMAMDHAGLGLVHALSGGICSHLHLHHGLANAMILPFVIRFNAEAFATERLTSLARVFGLGEATAESVAGAVAGLVHDLGLPSGLGGLGPELDQIDWDAVATESMRMVMVDNNPRTVTIDDCHQILADMRG